MSANESPSVARWETSWPDYAHEQWPWPVHVLKTIDPYFDAVRQGRKRFEIRRNDRQFQPDDLLLLAHWTGQEFTGRAVLMKVTYVLRDGHDFGLADDFVCMSLAPFANEDLRRSFAAGPAKASEQGAPDV